MEHSNTKWSFKRLTGSDVLNNARLFDDILCLDRTNMEPIMKASNFANFPWDKRIKGLTDADTILFAGLSDSKLIGYLEIHPNRLNGETVYISSFQIHPEFRGTPVFSRLLCLASSWFLTQDRTQLATEVQTKNTTMISILNRIGFVFQNGRHEHTKHAVLSKKAFENCRILNRITKRSTSHQ